MPGYTEYNCPHCGKRFSKETAQGGELVRKVVQFITIGQPSKIVKSITTTWLCKQCLVEDSDYQREPFRTPGQISPGRERVRLARQSESPDAT